MGFCCSLDLNITCLGALIRAVGLLDSKYAFALTMISMHRRYPPVPFFPPIAFYSAVRLGDPEQLAKIMNTDPYFITQDNGAGAPVHFATTYKQLDMVGQFTIFPQT